MNFPIVATPDGPAHSFLNLAPKTPPPFRWEVEKADVQEFCPEALEEKRRAGAEPVLDLFSLMPKGS